MTSVQRKNALVAATTLLLCLPAVFVLLYIGGFVTGTLRLELLGFFLIAIQSLFPLVRAVVWHGDETTAVFSVGSAWLLTCLQWLVVAAVFGWCFRNDARPRRVIPFALLTVAGVTVAACLVIAACGASLDFDVL